MALLDVAPADALPNGFDMRVEPQSNTQLKFLVTNHDGTCATQMQVTVTTVPGNTPVTPTSTVAQDANNVVVTLPAGTASPLSFDAKCDNDGEHPVEASIIRSFATVNVTKVVQGPDTPSTTFTVHFDCKFTPDGAVSSAQGFLGSSASVHSSTLPADSIGDLQYGSTGGTSPFYDFVGPATCTLTETNTGGAQSTSITPNPVDVVDLIVYSATVTNTFPPLPPAPAAPVVVAPRFTG